ncbi:MAG: cytochrome b/b6 domain-containing protein [Burkholderiales bacterium]|nr:cytochrome b/b6 domain-containing protein [Burkholderiales bacterium]
MNAEATTSNTRVLVWDLPVRVFHWLMVASFVLAWLTAESERWRLVHVTLGYTMAGLVAFRIVWGLVGSKPARFASFVRGPAAVKAYLLSLRARQPEHHTGHNPAGALAIVGLLGLTALTTAFGWAAYNELGGEWLAEGHEVLANTMILLVGVHLLGVVSGSLAHGENLARAMVTGRKAGQPQEAAERSAWPLGVLLLVAVLGFWVWQWQTAPAAPATSLSGLISSLREHDHDDD